MMWQERRSVIRHAVELPVKYHVLAERKETAKTDSKTARSDYIKDISESGLLFLSAKNFQVGVLLELTFPVKDRVFTMQGRVVHASRDSDSKLYRTGIYFAKADSVFKIKMAEQLYQIDEYRKTLSEEEGHVISEEEAAHRWIEKHSREFAEFYR